jgi:hypothetical protein
MRSFLFAMMGLVLALLSTEFTLQATRKRHAEDIKRLEKTHEIDLQLAKIQCLARMIQECKEYE